MAGSRVSKHTKKGPRQQTLDAMIARTLSSSRGLRSSNTASVAADADSEDDDLPLVRSLGRKTKRSSQLSGHLASDDVLSPYCLSMSAGPSMSSPSVAAAAARRARIPVLDNEQSDSTLEIVDEESHQSIVELDSDEEDVRPIKRRRGGRPSDAAQAAEAAEANEAGQDSDMELAEVVEITTPPAKFTSPPERASSTRSARKSARSVRQRHMELLRRRRRGEKVTESDLEREEEEEDEGEQVALYDPDPVHAALSEFEDEEEEEEEADRAKKKSKKKDEQGRKETERADKLLARDLGSDNEDNSGGEGGGQDSEMDDFIDDSHVGLIGEPDVEMLRREMPLQFSAQSRKPLKSHFRDAVEWLVQRRLEPQDEKGEKEEDAQGSQEALRRYGPSEELFRLAWDRLDREVGGLAQSRFMSATWTASFVWALRARPLMDSFDMRALKDPDDLCQACGRTRHPATWRIRFGGAVYDADTLEDDDGDKNDDVGPVDMQGTAIPPMSQQWQVGSFCHSNAETAHALLHWRRSLKDAVEERLVQDGQLTTERLAELGRMNARRRRAAVVAILDAWEAEGTIGALYGDFDRMLQLARAKSNRTGRWGR